MMELETPNDFDYLDNLALSKADTSTQTCGLDEGFFDFKAVVKEESLESRMLMSGCMPWYQNGVQHVSVEGKEGSPPISPDSTSSYHAQQWLPSHSGSGYMMLVPQSPTMASIIIPSSPTITSTVQEHIVGYIDDKKAYPKPVYSYSCLIAMALKQSKDSRLPVSEIYQFMQTEFPYFRSAPEGWKNSVRHNLSLNKAFYKLERPEGSSHKKGCYWMLNPDKSQAMDREIEKWKRKHPEAIRSSMLHPEEFWDLNSGTSPSSSALPTVIPTKTPQRFHPYSSHPKRYSSESQFTPPEDKENTPLNCYPENDSMWEDNNPAMFSTMLEPSPNYPSVAVRYQV